MRNIKVCKKCENYFIKDSEILKFDLIVAGIDRLEIADEIDCCSLFLGYVDDVLKIVPAGCEYKLEHEILK